MKHNFKGFRNITNIKSNVQSDSSLWSIVAVWYCFFHRPILVLKCEQGFVGYKSASSSKLECNKATYETIQVERSEKGIVFFKGQYSSY
jgi:fascin 1/2